MPIQIVPMSALDWPAVAAIYRQGIATGHATFATAPPDSWETWCAGKINAYGFRQVGLRERIGRMDHGPRAGEWRDVVLLERRSSVVGV